MATPANTYTKDGKTMTLLKDRHGAAKVYCDKEGKPWRNGGGRGDLEIAPNFQNLRYYSGNDRPAYHAQNCAEACIADPSCNTATWVVVGSGLTRGTCHLSSNSDCKWGALKTRGDKIWQYVKNIGGHKATWGREFKKSCSSGESDHECKSNDCHTVGYTDSSTGFMCGPSPHRIPRDDRSYDVAGWCASGKHEKDFWTQTYYCT